MSRLGDLKQTISRFSTDANGNFGIMFGILSTTLLLAVGFGVNIAQSYEVRSSLREALDAAITSTARDLTTGKIAKKDARASVERFLNANRDTRFVTDGTFALDSLVVDDIAKTVNGVAVANVSLAFPFFADNNPRVAVGSAATYSDKQVEVAMMLDVTGSMAKTKRIDKIGALQDAAENAVKYMLKNQDPKNPRIRVALVPYSYGVNAGGLKTAVYGEKAGSADLPPLANDGLFTKITGGVTLPLYSVYTSIVSAAFPTKGNCATDRKMSDGDADLSADGPDTVRTDKNGKKYYALVNRDDRLAACPAAEIIPLTADSASLLDSIENFKAGGSTAGAIGVQWAYYMLSPKWRSAIKDAGLGAGPANYDTKKITKVAILMTDGQFNTAFAGIADGKQTSNGKGDFTPGDKSRARAESLCTNMKDDSIQIYTIGFDLDDPGMSVTERDQAKAVLKNCATPDKGGSKHYFEASTPEELDAAFSEIIRNTETVALTK